MAKTVSLGVLNPEGMLITKTSFFTNHSDASIFATKFAKRKVRLSKHDNSNLEWKTMKREGWRIVPVMHTPVES